MQVAGLRFFRVDRAHAGSTAATGVDGAGDGVAGEAGRRRRRNHDAAPRPGKVERGPGSAPAARDRLGHTAMAELREADGGGAGMVRGGRRQRGWNQGVSPRSLVLYTVAEGAVVRLGLGARVSATGSLSELR